jgi:hypothetical protein
MLRLKVLYNSNIITINSFLFVDIDTAMKLDADYPIELMDYVDFRYIKISY